MSDFIDIDGNALPPNKTLRSSIYTLLNTPSDIKLCNYYQSYDTLIIETIPEYLSRVIIEQRSPGSIVTVLTPKDDYTPASPYNIETISIVVPNYDTKYYAFKDGIADENFVEVELKDSYVTELLFDQNILTAKRNNSLPDLTVELPFDVSDGLRSGGLVTWLTGFEYAVSSATYYLLGTRYVSDSGTVTLDASDATHDRIDVITVNDIGEIEVIKGTPAAEPLKPSIDPLTQIELTFIYVPANATEPTGVTGEVVYDENIEWTASANGVTVDFDSTTGPYNGMKCADVGTIGNYDTITFTASSPKNVADYETLSLFLKLKIAASTKNDVQIEFILSGQPVSDRVSIGWNIGKVGTWQSIALLMSEFAFTSATFDAVKIIWRRTSFVFITHGGFYLDLVQLQKGVEQPETKGIELTGDVMGQGELGTPIPTELKEIITGGSYGAATKTLNITVDAKGRITAISENNISVADGREIELRENAGWVEWRYVGGSWVQLFEIPTGGGGSDVEAGDGMDFITNDPVTLGLPSTIDSTTENAVTETSHTHELGNINLDSITNGKGFINLYSQYVVFQASSITSSTDWIVPSKDDWADLFSFLLGSTYTIGSAVYIENKLRLNNSDVWDSLNSYPTTNELGLNFIGSGTMYPLPTGFVNLKQNAFLWTSDLNFSVQIGRNNYCRIYDNAQIPKIGCTIRLINKDTLLSNGETGIYVGNNGIKHKTVCINGVEWLAEDLIEYYYRDETEITFIDIAFGDIWGDIINNPEYTTVSYVKYFMQELTNHPPVTIHPDSASRASIDGNQVLKIEAQGGGIGLAEKEFEFCIVPGVAQTFDIDIYATVGYTITKAILESDGTLSGVQVKIAGTAVTGLNSMTVSTVTVFTSTALNIASEGNRITIVTSGSDTGTPTIIKGKIVIA